MANKVEVFLGGQDNLSPIFQKAETGFRSLVGAFALGNIAANLVTTTFNKLTSSLSNFAKQAVAYSSRVEELGIIVQNVGKNAGYSATSINYFVDSVKSAGISSAEAQTVITKMVQNNLDLSKSFDLARMSQDAATIAGVDSSEALERIIHGIVTLQPEVLRNMGIMVNLETEYKKFADTTGLTSRELSAYQKQQIAMNAVLMQGANIAGNYGAAMDTASKQARSFTRYIKDIYEVFGKLLLPVYHDIIFGMKDLFAKIQGWLEDHEDDIEKWGQIITKTVNDVKYGFETLAIGIYNVGEAIEYVKTLGGIIPEQEDKRGTLKKTWGLITNITKSLESAGWAASGAFEKMIGLGDKAAESFERMGVSRREAWEALMGNIETSSELTLAQQIHFKQLVKDIKDTEQAIIELGEKYPKLQAYIEDYQAAYAKGEIDRATYMRELNSAVAEMATADAKRRQDELAAEAKKEQAAKATQKRLEEQAKLQTETTQKIMELTLEETDFKIWKVDEAYKKEQQLAKGNKALLTQLETAYYLELTKLATEYVNKKMEEDEKYGEWFHENQMRQIEEAKKSLADQTALLFAFDIEYAQIGKSQFDLEREQIKKRAEMLMSAAQDDAETKIRITKWAADEIDKINKRETASRLNVIRSVTGYMADNFKQISEMGGKHSKEAFAMYKAFKITETLISTYSAAIKAFEALAPIPVVGPALGYAAAAMAIGFGMAQVAMIKAAQPPSYDQGGISRARGIYQTGNVDEAHIPLQGGRVPVQMSGNQGNTVIVHMENPTFQDVDTQRRVFAQIAEVIARRVAPNAIVENYQNDGLVRNMIRSRS